MKEQFSKLIDVKTIVTFAVTAVLAYLSVTAKITPDQFMVIAVMIFTYFFTKQPTPDTGTTVSKTTTTTESVTPIPENPDEKPTA